MVTAVKLQQLMPNADIAIYESDCRLGGVIHTEECDNFLVDHGADMFATHPPDAMKLCDQLGVSDSLIEPLVEGRGAKIVHKGRLLPLPEGFVLMRATQTWPMLKTPLLSLGGKIRFLWERWVPKKRDTETRVEDESIADFVSRRMGKEMLDRIVAPLTAGIYTADINRLSMLATMGPIAKMETDFGSLAKATSVRRKSGQDSVERNSAGARYSQFRAFPGGMIQLIEALEAKLPRENIHKNCKVQRIQQNSDSSWEITLPDETVKCDEVVLATPPKVSAKLLEDLCPKASKTMSQIESSSVAIAVLGVHKSQISKPADCFGFVVPLNENRKILACSFASAKFAHRAPENHVLIRVFVGGAMQAELLQKTDDAIIELVRDELSELIGLSGEPAVAKVVRWNEAMPQYHVGHLERIKIIEEEISKIPSLMIVSNAMHGVGISPVISQASKVATHISERYVELSHPPSGQ